MANREKEIAQVSVIILNYRTDQLVLDLLKSLGNKPEIEVIVVDNSPENTLENKLKNFSGKYYFTGRNLGFSGGNNFGIKKASAPWILLLNSDTITTSEDILKLLVITKQKGAKVAAPKLVGKDGNVQNNVGFFDSFFKHPVNWLFVRPRFINCVQVGQEQEVDLLTGATMLIQKDVFGQVGFLDDKNYFMYFEDIDFSYRLHQKGIKVLYVPQVKITHFGGGSSDLDQKQKTNNYYTGLDNYLLKFRGRVIQLLNAKIGLLR